MNWEDASRFGRRVFYDDPTDTLRLCPENYLLAVRATDDSAAFVPTPDKAAPVNAHSLGLVLTHYRGLSPEGLAQAVEEGFWGQVGGHRACLPGMRLDMDVDEAAKNGYLHGFQGVVTEHVCALTKGTAEQQAWLEGYRRGEADAMTGGYQELSRQQALRGMGRTDQ